MAKAKKLKAERPAPEAKAQKKGSKGAAINIDFWDLIAKLIEQPLVRVNRRDFLNDAFGKVAAADELERILNEGPPRVVSIEAVDKVASDIVSKTRLQTTAIAAALGLPPIPLPALPAAAAADLTQTFGFWLVIVQKLAYLYGEDDLTTLDDKTMRSKLTLSSAPCSAFRLQSILYRS